MADRMLGLTDVYNLVYSPSTRSDDEEVNKLRDLHVGLGFGGAGRVRMVRSRS